MQYILLLHLMSVYQPIPNVPQQIYRNWSIPLPPAILLVKFLAPGKFDWSSPLRSGKFSKMLSKRAEDS